MPQLLFRGLFDAESTPNEEIVVVHKLIDVNSFREIYQLAWEDDANYNQSLALDAYRLFNSVLLVHAEESISKVCVHHDGTAFYRHGSDRGPDPGCSPISFRTGQ